jgi:hypothetical protein
LNSLVRNVLQIFYICGKASRDMLHFYLSCENFALIPYIECHLPVSCAIASIFTRISGDEHCARIVITGIQHMVLVPQLGKKLNWRPQHLVRTTMSKKFTPRSAQPAYPPYNANPITLEEEVTAGVIEWYMALGQPVPPEDLEACRGIDAALKADVAAEMAAPAPVAPAAYGTPEFWKQWWAKKRAKEAAAKAAAPSGEAASAAGESLPEPKKSGKNKRPI